MPATLKSRFPMIVAGLEPRVNAAVKAGAELIAGRASVRVADAPPEGKGLTETIHVESTEEAWAGAGTEGGYLVVAGDEENFHGHFLEFGTSKMAAQPFLIPAAEESTEEVAGLVSAVLRRL